MRFLKSDIILIFLIFSALVITVFRFTDNPCNVITWDVFGYYLYLPATFIYHDLSLNVSEWLDGIMNSYKPSGTLYQIVYPGNGNGVIKYTSGLAFIYLPLFLAGHIFALLTPFAADGMSAPYQYALIIGGLTWAFWGLFVLKNILHYYFSRNTNIIILIIIIFGTNYFQLISFDGTLLSHNFLFTLYALLVWLTIKWYDNPLLKRAATIGIICGLIILIRPSEIVCLLIPLLWNFNTITKKIKFLSKHFTHLLIAGGISIVVFIPQLLYWKYTTGSLFFYSYTNPGEGFDFFSPYTLKFLFSFRKGWLIYTPVMIFAFAGFFYLFKKNRKIFMAIVFFFVMDLWVVSSWSCWWYAGGSYSSRSLLPAYVLLALPLGYFIQETLKKKILQIIFFLLITFFIVLNLFQTWQFENGIISQERMTREYYFAIFGKTSVEDSDKDLLLVDRSTTEFDTFYNKEKYNSKKLYSDSFEEYEQVDSLSFSGNGSYRLTSKQGFLQALDIKYRELTPYDHAWIEASVMVFLPDSLNIDDLRLVAAFHHNGKAYKYRGVGINKSDAEHNKWNKLGIIYLTPEVRSKEDNLKIYLWNRGRNDVYVDDFLVKLYEPQK